MRESYHWLRRILVPVLILCAVAPAWGEPPNDRRPGRILYQLKPGCTAQQRAHAMQALGLIHAQQAVGNDRYGHADVDLNGRSEEQICAQMIASGGVEYAEPDYACKPTALPNDPLYSNQWQHSKIKSPQAWDLTTGSNSIIVAVCDTGVQSNHPDLSSRLVLPGLNAVDNSTNTEPINQHGTFVSGCIAAAGNNGTGVTGVAWNVRILPIKISNLASGVAYLSDMSQGIRWAADQGARIVNLSYGGAYSATIDSAAQYARGKDTLLFMSAGNDNTDISAWTDWSSFVLVAATDSSDNRSSFSNYGTPVDVTAPGSSVYSTTMNSGYSYGSGTSYSCPITAGVAALMLSATPALTVSQLETRLFNSCVDLGASGNDSVFGHGRVDAFAAVQAALVNTAPVANNASYATDESNPVNGTLNATDAELNSLTYSIVANGSTGTAVINDASTGTFTYTPDPGTNGTVDNFTFKANDGNLDSANATVTVARIGSANILPAPPSTFTSSSVTLYWLPVSGATQYWLVAGTSSAALDLFSADMGTKLSHTITNLPQDASAVHVRLYALVSGSWNSADYAYTAFDGRGNITSPSSGSTLSSSQVALSWNGGSAEGVITSPAPGSTLTSATQTFSWNAGVGVDRYWLTVGSTAGAQDLFTADAGTNTSYQATGLSQDGSTLYVRLYSRITDDWLYKDYIYTALDSSGDKATMTSPAGGSTLSGSSESFTWSAGTGVSQYWLTIGSSVGAQDLLSQDTAAVPSAALTGLPVDARTLYVRLFSKIASHWFYQDYTYTAFDARGNVTSPNPGSSLSSTSATFSWSAGTGVTEYWLTVGSSLGAQDYHGQSAGSSTSAAVTGLPSDGSSTVHVRLHSKVAGAWLTRDYSYIAFDGRADIISPSGGSTLTSSSQTFSWSAGSSVDQYWITVGSTPGATDYVTQDAGTATSAALSGLPTDGNTMHVRLYSRMGANWYQNDYTYTAFDGKAVINSPAQGATLTAASQTFSWVAGTGVNQYWLSVGTTQGAQDIYNQDQGTNLTAAVTGLPQNGSTIHARLYSRLGTVWVQQDFTYTAVSGVGKIATPADGSNLAGTSQQVSWLWSPGSLATQYWLTAGSSAGASEYFTGDMGTNTAYTLTGLPTDGSTIHVRLFSLIGSDWLYEDVSYTAIDGRGAITSPSSGATLSASSQTFSWNAGSGVDQFWLTVGSSAGGSQYFTQDMASGTSQAVTGLPTDGTTIYVRLFSRFGASWASRDYSYTALNGRAQIASPSSGSTLPASQAAFSWSAGTGAQQYWLTAGSSPGSQDYFSKDMGTAQQGWLTGLPANGGTVYVRLHTRIGSTWLYQDATYTAFSGTSQYWLTAGSTAGGSDYFSGDMGLQTSFTLTGLPTDSGTVYVRLYSRIGDQWLYRDYTYTASAN